jgi:hypothetical protein
MLSHYVRNWNFCGHVAFKKKILKDFFMQKLLQNIPKSSAKWLETFAFCDVMRNFAKIGILNDNWWNVVVRNVLLDLQWRELPGYHGTTRGSRACAKNTDSDGVRMLWRSVGVRRKHIRIQR